MDKQKKYPESQDISAQQKTKESKASEGNKKVQKETVDKAAQKLAVVEATLKKIEKDFGIGAASFLDDDKVRQFSQGFIPTGSIQLDIKLGIGGIPKGRITEIFGAEGCGKTTLALTIIANAQRDGGICAFIDAEHAINREYAKALGVDLKRLILCQPNTAEEGLKIAEDLIKSGGVDLIVVDSVAALVPQEEAETTVGHTSIGSQARLMSVGLRRMVSSISNFNCAVVLINQIRYKIGVMYGSPETTTGGNALKFYAAVRIELKRKEALRDNTGAVFGHAVEAKVLKNKFAPPFISVNFDIIYGKGIDTASEVVDLTVSQGIIIKSGAWFSYNGMNIGQGKEAVKGWFQGNQQIYNQLKEMVSFKAKANILESSNQQDEAVEE